MRDEPPSYTVQNSENRRFPASLQKYCVKQVPKISLAQFTSAFQNAKIKINFENESRVIGNHFNSLFIPHFNLIIKINLVWCGSYYSSQRYFESLQRNRDVLEHLIIGGIFFFGLLYAIFKSINENNQIAVLQFLKLRKTKIM